MPLTTRTRSVAVKSGLDPEPDLRRGHDQSSGSLDSESLRIDAQIVVLMGAPVPLPVQPHPLISFLVRVVDEPRGFFGADAFALHRARDQGLPRRVAEHVKSVLALGQHLLGAAANDYDRPPRDRFL